MRCLERTLRRADLPVALSQGFNPRPKAVFALALGLGIEGRNELLELELTEPLEAGAVLSRLRAAAPTGFDFLAVEPLGPGRRARVVAACYELAVPPKHHAAAAEALAAFLASSQWPYQRHRPDRSVEADLRPFLLNAAIDAAGMLRFRMRIAPEGSARPEEFLTALGLNTLTDHGAVLVRSELELAPPDPAPRGAPIASDRPRS